MSNVVNNYRMNPSKTFIILILGLLFSNCSEKQLKVEVPKANNKVINESKNYGITVFRVVKGQDYH